MITVSCNRVATDRRMTPQEFPEVATVRCGPRQTCRGAEGNRSGETEMEEVILILVILFFFAELATELGLNELNLRFVQGQWAKRKIPEFLQDRISLEEYEKSVAYTEAKGRFQRWAELYGGLILLSVLFSGVLPAMDRLIQSSVATIPFRSQWIGIIFCMATGFLFNLLSLPTDLYATFVIEERFGFNKTTPRLYGADKAKSLLLSILIGSPFLFGLLYVMEALGAWWWFWAFVFVLSFQLLMIWIYPALIAPLFNKFRPLGDSDLRDRILALADRLGFRAGGIFVMDGSKRSAHSNAYFTGLGKIKRIVLFDTLIERMDSQPLLSVLAHEIGHYKMKHTRRILVVEGVFLLLGFAILGRLVNYEPFFRAFGFPSPSNHTALVLFALLGGLFTFYLGPLFHRLSRKHEYEADHFAVQALKDGDPLEEALIRLTRDNLSNPTPHPLYSAYHYSHPTVTERIRAIREAASALGH